MAEEEAYSDHKGHRWGDRTANEHKKGHASWEVRNKIKTRYHLPPSGLAVRRAADNIRCCWGCREWHSQRLMGEEMSTAVLKGKLALFIKTESFTSYDPEIAMFPRKTLSMGQERFPGMLRAASAFVRTQMFRSKREGTWVKKVHNTQCGNLKIILPRGKSQPAVGWFSLYMVFWFSSGKQLLLHAKRQLTGLWLVPGLHILLAVGWSRRIKSLRSAWAR